MRGTATNRIGQALIGGFGGLLLAAALGLVGAGAGAGASARAGIYGPWLSEKEALIVDLYPCAEDADEVCGRIAWMLKPYRDGKLRRDTKNPDPALRDRPFCGIEVIEGLRPDGEDRWSGGKVYDPKRGDTYSLDAKLKAPDRLELRAYLGFKFLGKTETWTRPDPGHRIACVDES